MTKTTTTKKKKEEKPKFSDQFAFESWFKVIGCPGIFYPRTRPNASGMINMKELMGDTIKTVHVSKIKGVDQYLPMRFGKMADKPYTMANLFDAIHKSKKTAFAIGNMPVDKQRKLLKVDEDFGKGHIKRVLGWYGEIAEKLEAIEANA